MKQFHITLFIFFLITLILPNTTLAQNRTLVLNLEGIKYDSLFLSGVNINNQGRLRIKGKAIGNNKWQFSIPDTAYCNFKQLSICSHYITREDPTERIIFLSRIIGKDTVKTSYFNFDNLLPEINAAFLKTKTIKIKYARPKADGDNELFDATQIADILEVHCDDKSDFTVRLKYPDFGFFFEMDDKGYDYQAYVDEYASIISTYPESQFLAIALYKTLNKYKSKEDLKKVFNNFSQKVKQSAWGQRINDFIETDHFVNLMLPECNSGKDEPIIRDINKYTLVLFSASWCSPCIRQIPVLKEIYKNMSDKLDMVYISIDNTKEIDAWKELMTKEEIPWRSLLAAREVLAIRQKYYISGVPTDILVKPGGLIEEINLSESDGKENLYKIIRNG